MSAAAAVKQCFDFFLPYYPSRRGFPDNPKTVQIYEVIVLFIILFSVILTEKRGWFSKTRMVFS
jgi:hypothetical protein